MPLTAKKGGGMERKKIKKEEDKRGGDSIPHRYPPACKRTQAHAPALSHTPPPYLLPFPTTVTRTHALLLAYPPPYLLSFPALLHARTQGHGRNKHRVALSRPYTCTDAPSPPACFLFHELRATGTGTGCHYIAIQMIYNIINKLKLRKF